MQSPSSLQAGSSGRDGLRAPEEFPAVAPRRKELMNGTVEHGEGSQPQCEDSNETSGKTRNYSSAIRLDRLLETVATEVKLYAFDQISQIKRLTNIGIALCAEQDINRLLEMIVNEARNITGATAGILCLSYPGEKVLKFEILQNGANDTRMGGTSGVPVDIPPIPFERNGVPNFANVLCYVAITGQTLNVPDVSRADGFDFRSPLDHETGMGQISQSMLVTPVRNREGETIGVLQLLNARDRPYKSGMNLTNAIKILNLMMRQRHLDPDLLHLFLESNLPETYAEKELGQEQIDGA
jgi:GAF domain-containing protein